MNYLDKVRAGKFDMWVGERQTLKSMELGVGDTVLDVGCGVGQFTYLFLRKFKTVVGLDPNEKYIKVAIKNNPKIIFIQGYGETFETEMKFDTINMTNLLEHVDDPVKLLKNCKNHLRQGGRIIAQVPNANSIARRLGVLMGIISNIEHISKKEREFYGHQRTYTVETLMQDVLSAKLKVLDIGGILYKPLPNEMLEKICQEKGKKWRNRFIDALIEFGEDWKEDCAELYICASG